MNRAAIISSIEYGRSLMTQVTSKACGADKTPEAWKGWTSRLFASEEVADATMDAAWSLVQTPGSKPAAASYIPVDRISLDFESQTEGRAWHLNPRTQQGELASAASELADEFVRQGGATETNFDRFYSLMRIYGSALPCTYGEYAVSLFRQWALVAAMLALAPDGTPESLPADLALIGLDLPGIQETVYTIASRGAGKGVRGRSAFVQLLVHAITERIVRELGLCRANVLVAAGGNALLLCAWTPGLEQYLRELDAEINRTLFGSDNAQAFAGFRGDLSLALAVEPVPWECLYYPNRTLLAGDTYVSLWQQHEKLLKDKLRQAKQRPFAALLAKEDDLRVFFRPDQIDSARYCAVCRRPESNESGSFLAVDDDEGEAPAGAQSIVCPTCHSFRKLAEDLARHGVYLNRSQQSHLPTEAEVWQRGLHAISGNFYRFTTKPLPDHHTDALSPNGFPAAGVDGFWPLARTTPMDENQILDNQTLAEASPGSFKRIGVLKADVDDLGAILVGGLDDKRTAALTATISESLTLFFGGWLDQICSEPQFSNKVYVLYAGGDDLLIIGTWNVMPVLAGRIAADFNRYTGRNPSVHLSAGISVVGGKEPLYAAIAEADGALHKAKSFNRAAASTKNAICFMDEVVDWVRFEDVQIWNRRLRSMLDEGVPSSLLSTLLQIYAQYLDDRRKLEESTSGYATRAQLGRYGGNGRELYLGPWLWQMIYRLRRVANDDKARAAIQEVQDRLLMADGIHTMALSARWAQIIARKQE